MRVVRTPSTNAIVCGGMAETEADAGYVAGTGISIYVPITGTDEAVAVPVDQLPEDVDEVLGILQAELAPLGLWLDFAKAYLQRGKEEQFRAILESGCSPGARRGAALIHARPQRSPGVAGSIGPTQRVATSCIPKQLPISIFSFLFGRRKSGPTSASYLTSLPPPPPCRDRGVLSRFQVRAHVHLMRVRLVLRQLGPRRAR